MWLLVEVEDLYDAGKNEKRRLLLGDNDQVELNVIPYLKAEAHAIEVHPMTPGK